MRFLYRALRWLELGTQNPQKLTVGAYPCVYRVQTIKHSLVIFLYRVQTGFGRFSSVFMTRKLIQVVVILPLFEQIAWEILNNE